MSGRPSDPLLALLRRVAAERGMNTAALAQAIGVERAHLKRVLAGRQPLTVDELIGLATALELGPEDLGGVPLAGGPDIDAHRPEPAAEPAEGDAAPPPGAGEDGRARLSMLADRGPSEAAADPIGAAADPYGNHAAQVLRLGLALGCDILLGFDSAQVQDSGVPRDVLARYPKTLPIRLDAAYHRHHDLRFLPTSVRMTLSFDALYTCEFPWQAIQQVTLFPLPPDLSDEPDEEEEPEDAPPRRGGFLRLVE
ncbi:MAG: XRE family transcriptional regulator [Deltaproteobacteria bacterium]|nr:MAG: XRE family transcriptional regulator [Deltaproteobacteria bacterium]